MSEEIKLEFEWGIVELMGHRRLAGKLSEQTIAGAVLLRIDAPQADGTLRTAYYGASAIYALHPTDEATARAVAAHHAPEPIQRWELLPPAAGPGAHIGYADDDPWAPSYAGARRAPTVAPDDEDADEPLPF